MNVESTLWMNVFVVENIRGATCISDANYSDLNLSSLEESIIARNHLSHLRVRFTLCTFVLLITIQSHLMCVTL